ncbi:PAAR domain-containing protein [Stutzerimonas nitrititolerans]|uniref:PAAR domain-containing protein n=1 Tax=Stutzerimonas nitrititolerans TaxID=2482751 RepID=UPI0028B17D42|nr:PAAR domain-containing protein [Stutzerimonas nitrititolerans]
MSGKPAARVGDPTACPKTGHGNNPITSGSPDVLFDGLPAARQGDPTGCGSALTGDLIANVLINGKPVATLDSLGDHGNVVIGGSGSVIIGNTPVPAPFSPLAALNLQPAAERQAGLLSAEKPGLVGRNSGAGHIRLQPWCGRSPTLCQSGTATCQRAIGCTASPRNIHAWPRFRVGP